MDTSPNQPSEYINVALIGDGYVGKTCILNSLQKTSYSTISAPTVYNEISLEIAVHGRKFIFNFMDTAGQEEYDPIRREVYEKADIFLLCFSVADKVSYQNIIPKWIPDLSPYKSKPFILLGTKVDLRINSSGTSISTVRGIQLQKKIGAKLYVECSSKTGKGISNIIEAAVNVLLTNTHKKSCVIQ